MPEHTQSLVECLAEVRDFRREHKKLHRLVDILAIAVCSVIANGDDWQDMEEFGKIQHDWLKTWLLLPNGIPSHDTFRRVFVLLPPEHLQYCFQNWVQTLLPGKEITHIAIDGKTLRSSGCEKKGKAAIHMVSAFASQHGLVLAQLKNGDKSNEITAIPELLERLDLNGATVTIDAMGAQKNIAEKIVAGGGEYILALKDNQPTLAEAVKLCFLAGSLVDFKDRVHEHCQTVDEKKRHGRWERRSYYLLKNAGLVDPAGEWKNLSWLGWVHRECRENGKTTHEDRYYLVSGSPTVGSFREAVRGHWGIENRLHWVLDVAFGEDDIRINAGYGAANFGVLRHMVVNLLREEKSNKRGIQAKRKKAAWDVKYLEKVLNVTIS